MKVFYLKVSDTNLYFWIWAVLDKAPVPVIMEKIISSGCIVYYP